MEVNYHFIILRAVEEGISLGVNRAYKHIDHPTKEFITEQVSQEIMQALSEVFNFQDYERKNT